MENWLEHTELLIGTEGVERLQDARVAVLGLGGVGSAAAEGLCRAGRRQSRYTVPPRRSRRIGPLFFYRRISLSPTGAGPQFSPEK